MDENNNLGKQDTVEKVEFPKEGGILTYLKGRKFPFPGFPHEKMVERMAFIKAMIPALVKGASYAIGKDRIKPDKYCRFVREIYRLFNLLIEREKGNELKNFWAQMRDVICMILEFDNAYRFRMQDILSEINLDEVKPDENTKYYMDLHDDYDFGGRKTKKS